MRVIRTTWKFVPYFEMLGRRALRVVTALLVTLAAFITPQKPLHAQELFHISLGNYYATLVEPLPGGELLVAGDHSRQLSDVSRETTPFLLRLEPSGRVIWLHEAESLAGHRIKAVTKINTGFAVLTESNTPEDNGSTRVMVWAADEQGRVRRSLAEVANARVFDNTQPLFAATPEIVLFAITGTDPSRASGGDQLRAVNLSGDTIWELELDRTSVSPYAALSDGRIGILQPYRRPKIIILDNATGKSIGEVLLRFPPEGGFVPYGLFVAASGQHFEVVARSLKSNQKNSPTRQTLWLDKAGAIARQWSIGEDLSGAAPLGHIAGAVTGESFIAKLEYSNQGSHFLRYDREGTLLGTHPILSAFDTSHGTSLHRLRKNKIAMLGNTRRSGFGYHYAKAYTNFLRIIDLEFGLPNAPEDCLVNTASITSLENELRRTFAIHVIRQLEDENATLIPQLGDPIPERKSCGLPTLLSYREFLQTLIDSLSRNVIERFPGDVTLRVAAQTEDFRTIPKHDMLRPFFIAGVDKVDLVVGFFGEQLGPALSAIADLGANFPDTRVRLGQYTPPRTELPPTMAPTVKPSIEFATAFQSVIDRYNSLDFSSKRKAQKALNGFSSINFSPGTGVLDISTARQIIFSTDQVDNVIPFVLQEGLEKEKEAILEDELNELGLTVWISGIGRSVKRQELLRQLKALIATMESTHREQLTKLKLKLIVEDRTGRQPYGRDGLRVRIDRNHIDRLPSFLTHEVLHCYREGAPFEATVRDTIPGRWKSVGDSQIRAVTLPDDKRSIELMTGATVEQVLGLVSDSPLNFQFEPHHNVLVVFGSSEGRGAVWLLNLDRQTESSFSAVSIDSQNLPTGYGVSVYNVSPTGDQIALRLARYGTPAAASPNRLWVAVDSATGELLKTLKRRPLCDWWDNGLPGS